MKFSEHTINRIIERSGRAEGAFSAGACLNSDAVRRRNAKPEDPFLRPPFFRDSDRIIHSKAYSRYIDKTQVFYLIENEHITHRSIHVQLVSKIARTIGRALGYNEDLIEAAALGHDIGHSPFGHTGEKFLDSLCTGHGIGNFRHSVQGVRFLDGLEQCDLTLQVLDSILCHNGETTDLRLYPEKVLTWEGFDEKISLTDAGEDTIPSTFEGCIVRFADTIAYLGRDLQDATEVGLVSIKPGDLPEIPGFSPGRDINGAVIDLLCRDIIETSMDEEFVSFSDEVFGFVSELKDYNYENIYKNPVLHGQDEKIELMFEKVFEHYLSDVEDGDKSSLIYKDLIEAGYASREYVEGLEPAAIVRDYIAGMTDGYFMSVFKKIVLPERKFRDFG